MKLKVLATVGLSALALLAGCRGAANTNTANTAVVNSGTMNTAPTMAPTPLVQTGESAAIDSVLKGKIETALKGKGFNNVIVDASTGTLRGTYPKGRLAEVIQTVQQAAGKPLKNEMAEAK